MTTVNARPTGGLLFPRRPVSQSMFTVPAGGAAGTVLTKNSGADGDASFLAPTGGGGTGSFTMWDPDAPFSVPSAYDDEFTASTINVKWSQVNAASAAVLNTTDVPSQLRLTKTTNTTTKVALLQAIPAADFTAFMKLWHTLDGTNFAQAGFWLTDGVTAGAGNQYRAGLNMQAGALNHIVNRDTNFNTYHSTPVAVVTQMIDWGPYLRLTRSGTTLTLSCSNDGVRWQTIGSWTSAFTLTHLGLGYSHERASTGDEMLVDFYRVVTGTATARLGNSRIIITG